MYKSVVRFSWVKKAERRPEGLLQNRTEEDSMNSMNYIGLDIHKKSISCCVRQADGTIIQESTIAATRHALDEWMRQLPQPWMAGMEATLFTGWIYDHLVSGGALVKVAHPAMLQAIAAGKKKSDRVDARKIADLLRCGYFPECHMAPREIRDRRRVLRYRNLLVRQAVQMKNKVSGLLMEAGVPYNQQKVHQKKYFAELLQTQKKEMPPSMPELLRLSRSTVEALTGMQRQLIRALERDALLAARVERLASIPGVGRVVALTWALEMGDIRRFASVKKAVSYCGLCGAEKSSGGKTERTPISKQRNKHLQTILVEAAKLAPRWSTELALVYEREKQRGNRNRATLAVARKLVAYLMAVDREQRPFDTQLRVAGNAA
jgi:transposase